MCDGILYFPIHLSIYHTCMQDKRGFQAIRSTDVLKFFDKLFPRFVEWLGMLYVWRPSFAPLYPGPADNTHPHAHVHSMTGPHAANVHFDDPSTAKRALEAVSQPLPSLEEVLTEHDAQLATAAGREGEGEGDEHQKEGDAVGMAVEGEREAEQLAPAGAKEGEQAPGAATGEGMEGAAGAKGKGDHHRRHADLPVHGAWRQRTLGVWLCVPHLC